MTSASDALRQESATIWRSLHEHPFITELADGSLPLDRFRFFLEQDDLYLKEYARCLALGAAKSRTERELRYFTADLNQVLDAEIPSNRDLLARVIELGAQDRGGARIPAPANVAYTSYLQALSMRGGPLEIMAALLPCSWSYVDIATALRTRTDTSHPVYADWIGYFSRSDVVEMVAGMRRDFDELVEEQAPAGARRRDIGEIFAMSCRLERAFWQMAYTLDQWPDVRDG